MICGGWPNTWRRPPALTTPSSLATSITHSNGTYAGPASAIYPDLSRPDDAVARTLAATLRGRERV